MTPILQVTGWLDGMIARSSQSKWLNLKERWFAPASTRMLHRCWQQLPWYNLSLSLSNPMSLPFWMIGRCHRSQSVCLVNRAVFHVSVDIIPPSNLIGDMSSGSGIMLSRSWRLGNISNVTSFYSHSNWPASPNDAIIAWLCSSAAESSAMMEPERHINLKSPPLLTMLMTTLTSCFWRQPVSSVWSCFHDAVLPRQNAARVYVVRSNTIWHADSANKHR